MNERIKLLAEQAAKFSAIMALPAGESGDKLFVEKFAELIVRECAGVELYWLNEQDRKAVAEKIKKHFGVEE